MPAQGTPDYYAVSMLGTLLSQGQSSRLHKALIDEQQVAVAAGSFIQPMEDPGVNVAYAIANMGIDVLALENAIDLEIAKVQEESISDTEFQKLKKSIGK